MVATATVIQRSRFSAAVSALGSFAFVVIGWWLIFGDPAPTARYPREVATFWGVVVLVVFGWSALLGGLHLVRPGRLHLDSEGYWFEGYVRGPKVLWRGVEEFKIKKVWTSKHVEPVWRQGVEHEAEAPLRRFTRILLDGYPLSGLATNPEVLLQTLKLWRDRSADHERR